MPDPKPTCSALLVCDVVIEDKSTNKKTIVGAFTDIAVNAFPASHPGMGIYFCLTDAEGDYDIVLRILHSDSGDQLAEASFSVNIPDRLAINDFGVNLPIVPLPKAGRYEILLYVNKEFLIRKEFRANIAEGGES